MIKKSIIFVAIFCIAAGGLGMFYCLKHLYSKKVEDLIGAGFPFIAGAILIAGGLISISVIYSKKD